MAPWTTDTVDVPLLTLRLLLLPAPLVTQTEGVGVDDGDTLTVGFLFARVQFSHHPFTIQVGLESYNAASSYLF